MIDAFDMARDDPDDRRDHPHRRAGDEAFCSGGDQRIRGERRLQGRARAIGRLNVLDLQVQIRRLPEAGDRDGGRLRDRRRPRAARRLRPDHRRRQRPLRPDRPQGRQLRRRVRRRAAGAHGRAEEGSRDLVPVRAVRRPGGAGHGPGQQGRAAGRARGGNGRLVPARSSR